MKAKDWVKHISQLQPDTPEYDAAAEACAKECRDIFQMRVKSIRGGGKGSHFREQTSDRLVFAYKEAGVKWDSVAHGLLLLKREKEGPDAPPNWPFIKGMMLLNDIIEMLEKEGITEVQKAEFLSYHKMLAGRLGYLSETAFQVTFQAGAEQTANAVFQEILRVRGELTSMRLAAMMGHEFSMADIERAVALRQRLAVLTS